MGYDQDLLRKSTLFFHFRRPEKWKVTDQKLNTKNELKMTFFGPSINILL